MAAAAAVGDVDGSTEANEFELRAGANEVLGGWACNESRGWIGQMGSGSRRVANGF